MFIRHWHVIRNNNGHTKEEHLELCLTAFDKLGEKAMKWVKKKS